MTTRRLGLWDTGEVDAVVLCDRCADRMSRDGMMPAAELLERGGWILDETCDRCHCEAAPEPEPAGWSETGHVAAARAR